jgi:hypothetical protein
MAEMFSCLDRAMPGEPDFTLLARDPSFGRMVRAWADERERAVDAGDRPTDDRQQVQEAREIAERGERWRREHMYEWRRAPATATEA